MYILVVDQHDILKRNMAAVCTTIAGVFYGIDNIRGWQRGGTNHASRWIFKLNHVSRRTFLSNHASRKNN